jgi:hypothetical protein
MSMMFHVPRPTSPIVSRHTIVLSPIYYATSFLNANLVFLISLLVSKQMGLRLRGIVRVFVSGSGPQRYSTVSTQGASLILVVSNVTPSHIPHLAFQSDSSLPIALVGRTTLPVPFADTEAMEIERSLVQKELSISGYPGVEK